MGYRGGGEGGYVLYPSLSSPNGYLLSKNNSEIEVECFLASLISPRLNLSPKTYDVTSAEAY